VLSLRAVRIPTIGQSDRHEDLWMSALDEAPASQQPIRDPPTCRFHFVARKYMNLSRCTPQTGCHARMRPSRSNPARSAARQDPSFQDFT